MNTKTVPYHVNAPSLRRLSGERTEVTRPVRRPDSIDEQPYQDFRGNPDKTPQAAVSDAIRDAEQQLHELEDLRDAEADWHLYDRPGVKRPIVPYRTPDTGRCSRPAESHQSAEDQKLQYLNQGIQSLRDQLALLQATTDSDWYEQAEIKHLIIVREDERTTLVNGHDSRIRRETAARTPPQHRIDLPRKNIGGVGTTRDRPKSRSRVDVSRRANKESGRGMLLRRVGTAMVSLWVALTSGVRARRFPTTRRRKCRNGR